jgi:hypothetical protein
MRRRGKRSTQGDKEEDARGDEAATARECDAQHKHRAELAINSRERVTGNNGHHWNGSGGGHGCSRVRRDLGIAIAGTGALTNRELIRASLYACQ